MKMNAAQMKQLAKLAQIRSDAELKRFSAFRAHMDTVLAERRAVGEKLALSYSRHDAFSVAGARLASQESGRLAGARLHLDAEIARLTPGFDAARKKAAREFGRVEVLKTLATLDRISRRNTHDA
ncbi:glycoside hydrolase family 92 protein [Paracoccus aurantiacus]|uniref:Glycoside hydrolase family 92 protein n=1 Tax=Paracoccus aurantiacus TaxID=2599412 RepID=A0A5C6S362_9RHOB|nr:glycoside hydrolase family 92 protein [Paracoccus aurantiacus]TXB68062.1 glycoside hydrolase family 92 protein [Paracoccus aurantiacus]